jgi:hypothetical protein
MAVSQADDELAAKERFRDLHSDGADVKILMIDMIFLRAEKG